jgi:hypothetical protein
MSTLTNREIEERRFGAVQALRAVVECLRDTNPAAIFSAAKGENPIDIGKLQSINNRWADKASDVLMKALDLAEAVGNDGLALFKHPPVDEGRETSDATSTGA